VVTKAVNCLRCIATRPRRHAVENKDWGFAQLTDFIKSTDDSRNPDGIGRTHRNDRISSAQDFARRAVSLGSIINPFVLFQTEAHIDNHYVV
jgi:hypothetical protein